MRNFLGLKPGDKFQSYVLDPVTYQWSLQEFTVKSVDMWRIYTTNDQIRHVTTVLEYYKKFSIPEPNLGLHLPR